MAGAGARWHFVADDFGMTGEVNRAVAVARREGVLTGAALMMGQEGTEEAVALARELPGMEVGLHFHLGDSRPLTMAQWPWGRSPARAGVALGFSAEARRLARGELEAQWGAFQATGLRCDFVNFHHHLHAHPWVFGQVLRLVGEDFTGWMRLGRPRFFGRGPDALGMVVAPWSAAWRQRWGGRSPETLWGVDRVCAMRAEEVAREAKALTRGEHEFMFHPRRCGGDADLECLRRLRSLPGSFSSC